MGSAAAAAAAAATAYLLQLSARAKLFAINGHETRQPEVVALQRPDVCHHVIKHLVTQDAVHGGHCGG